MVMDGRYPARLLAGQELAARADHAADLDTARLLAVAAEAGLDVLAQDDEARPCLLAAVRSLRAGARLSLAG